MSVRYENDAFANQDGGYTNGILFTYLPANQAPDALLSVASALSPLSSSDGALPWSVTLKHVMFTPRDISEPEQPPEDRPYAGWLDASLSAFSLNENKLERFRIGVGVVGPSSGAEQVQKQVHEMVGANQPVGWDEQLADEVTLQLAYDRQWRLPLFGGGMEGEFTPTAGIALGNAFAGLETGAFMRVGRNIPVDFGPPRLRSLAGGSAFHGSRRGFGWFAFVGGAAQYVAHDITLDGSLFDSDAPFIDRRKGRWQAYVGVACFHGTTRVALTTALESKAFATQNGNTRYGALSVSWRL